MENVGSVRRWSNKHLTPQLDFWARVCFVYNLICICLNNFVYDIIGWNAELTKSCRRLRNKQTFLDNLNPSFDKKKWTYSIMNLSQHDIMFPVLSLRWSLKADVRRINSTHPHFPKRIHVNVFILYALFNVMLSSNIYVIIIYGCRMWIWVKGVYTLTDMSCERWVAIWCSRCAK